MTTSPTVKLSDLIAQSFYEVHKNIKEELYTHHWLKGGRGSCKSSFVSIEIILGMMKHPDANAVALRKVGMYLKDSVYEQLLWAISALGVEAYWLARRSPLELIYIPTGQRIIFRGADKPRKIKSTKVKNGYIRYLWYEEVDEFNGQPEIDTINQSLMRGGAKFDVFYSFNPPKSVRNWVNAAVVEPRKDKQVHHSDYRDVPPSWLGPQFIAEAEYLKESNPQRYANEYLGEVTGTGGEIFTNLEFRHISDEEIESFDHVYRGLDWGYGADPFSYISAYYNSTARELCIFYEFYKCGAKYDEIVTNIRKENTSNGTITAESAEPRSNDELRTRGLNITAAKKGKGSVEHGIQWLQNLNRIVIDPVRCPNTKREFYSYEHEPDGMGGFRSEFPDKDNHTIDATRYALESVLGRRYGKVPTIGKGQLGLY